MTLKSFPRGGKKPFAKASTNFLFEKTERIKTKRTKSKKSENSTHEEEVFTPTIVQSLKYGTLSEGMTVLGRVHYSNEYEITVSLPGRLNGYVQASDISESYTSLLQTLVHSSENHPSEFKPLTELYKRGDYVICSVKRMDHDEKHRVNLSLEPEFVNQSLDPAKLQKGSKIVCTIGSIEDHGYVVDTGIKVLRGFLSLKDIEDDVKYYPGQQIFCAIKSVKTEDYITTVKLSTKTKHTTSTAIFDTQPLDALIPGIRLDLTIKKILSNGVQVAFNGKNVGFINQLYLQKPLAFYEKGGDITGTLLYVLPTVKFAYFTELKLEMEKTTVEPGEIFTEAKVLYRESNGIVLHLKKGIRGFVTFKRTAVDYDDISSKFPPQSIHKCQVLTYDIFDRVYVCTMEPRIMNNKKKLLIPENVKVGDVTTVKIVKVMDNTGFVLVKSGKTLGYVAPEHLNDIDVDVKRKSDDNIEARVLGRNKEDNGWLFTLKKSLVKCDLPILTNVNDATIGATYKATIFRITDNVIMVGFFNNVKGVIRAKTLNAKTGGIKNFQIGQVILVKVTEKKDDGKLYLNIVTETDNSSKFQVGQPVTGTVLESSLDGIYLRITRDDTKETVTGFLPAGHMAPCIELGRHLSARITPGDVVSTLVFTTYPELILTRTFVPAKGYRDLRKLQKGHSLPCSISEINNDCLKVIMPINDFESYGIVAINNVDNMNYLNIHQVLFGKIVHINKKEQKIHLTTCLRDVWDNSQNDAMVHCVDVFTLYLTKYNELSQYSYYQSKPIASIRLGQSLSGIVDKVTDYGLVLKLENGVTATVRPAHYKGAPNAGDKINGKVIWINHIHELVELTLLPAFKNSISSKNPSSVNIPADEQQRAVVVLITDWFILAVLKGQNKGRLILLPAKSHANDFKPNLRRFTIGKQIRCYVVLNYQDTNVLPVGLVKAVFEKKKNSLELNEMKTIDPASLTIAQKFELSFKNACKLKPEAVESKRNKRKFEETSNVDKSVQQKELDETIEIAKRPPPPTTTTTAKLQIPECGFFWDTKPDLSLVTKNESSSDSEDDESENQPKKKKIKKLNATERRELERQKEREIRQREEFLASNQTPNSVDQFDRLILASPDSSIVWLQYMAFHLQATEIDKARTIAQRALKTINFREEEEKLNVWQAWLNLESRFGSPETLNSVFYEAINANDPMKIYLHMLTVHADANRQVDLEKTVKTITGKFKQNPEAWIESGAAFLKMGLKEKSRFTMQRALQSLPESEHVNLMVKFAQLENKFGDKERAQTLFEQILSSYVKRVDIWSAYVDTLVKSGDLDIARQVLEKAVKQTLPPKKMKTLFTKFINFEEQHGTAESVGRAKEAALRYVTNRCNN